MTCRAGDERDWIPVKSIFSRVCDKAIEKCRTSLPYHSDISMNCDEER